MDFNAYGFIPTIERVKDFDFTIPVQQDQYRFLVKYPEAESRLWGPIRPFQLPVWICFLFAIMAVILSLSWLMKCVNLKPKIKGRRLNGNGPAKLNAEHQRLTLTELVGRNAVYICTIITGQGEYFNERKLPVRILVAVWCLMALILVNSYTGNLISYLTVPRMKPVVNSFEELANSQETKLTIEAKNILSENILVNFNFNKNQILFTNRRCSECQIRTLQTTRRFSARKSAISVQSAPRRQRYYYLSKRCLSWSKYKLFNWNSSFKKFLLWRSIWSFTTSSAVTWKTRENVGWLCQNHFHCISRFRSCCPKTVHTPTTSTPSNAFTC